MTIRPLSWKELVRGFLNCGFEGPRYGKGKSPHPFMTKGTRKVPIPKKHRSTIDPTLIRRVIRVAGISEEEWEAATTRR